MIFFTFMTVRRHCRSRSAADCTFTIIHAEEWNLIWSISGWAPPMDCKKRYNELDAGTREVNGEINPNAQTESDKTSFFYYNISDFLVFYIYIYSYIFIYMLILQLRRKIWNKCWFNIRVYKKKKCFLLPHWHKCLKIFLKRPAKGQRSTQRIRRHCCMSYDSTAGKRKKITTMLHRNPVHIYLFFIFLRMNKHIKQVCAQSQACFFSAQISTHHVWDNKAVLRQIVHTESCFGVFRGTMFLQNPIEPAAIRLLLQIRGFPLDSRYHSFNSSLFSSFFLFLVCILLWLKSTGGDLYLHTFLSIRKLRKNVFGPFLGIHLVLINTLLKSGGTSFQYCGWQCVSEQKS